MCPNDRTAGMCVNISSSYFLQFWIDTSKSMVVWFYYIILLFEKLLFSSSGQYPNKNSNVYLDTLFWKSVLHIWKKHISGERYC